jgi:hypothetical protein
LGAALIQQPVAHAPKPLERGISQMPMRHRYLGQVARIIARFLRWLLVLPKVSRLHSKERREKMAVAWGTLALISFVLVSTVASVISWVEDFLLYIIFVIFVQTIHFRRDRGKVRPMELEPKTVVLSRIMRCTPLALDPAGIVAEYVQFINPTFLVVHHWENEWRKSNPQWFSPEDIS